MALAIASLPGRFRVIMTRVLLRIGFKEESFLLLLAALIGAVTAAAAVAFHLLIRSIRDGLYGGTWAREHLYVKSGIWLLVLVPAAGGLAVGLISRFVFRMREGHGIIDVIESVIRSRGIIRPVSAIEKILTSGLTIGTGGSAGAEGPIVQIGAGIASGIGQIFKVARPHMPILIGCGSAAGISAIFHSPIGGVLFTLEVMLQDFSIRTFTPIVLASVIANVTTTWIFNEFVSHERYTAIFMLPGKGIMGQAELGWSQAAHFIVLGLVCGLVGLALTRLTYWSEEWFAHLRVKKWIRPGIGGAMLGMTGVLYVIIFGWGMLHESKPIEFNDYPLPAFFSDGYGVVRQLVRNDLDPGGFYERQVPAKLITLLGALVILKIVGTCMTLSSGGSGGIIAPSLFLGASAGGFFGLVLNQVGAHVQPNVFALVGMGAVLAAVVHAPLASILILMELTGNPDVVLPAMLTTIVATGFARILFRDSIYTLTLRARGVKVGSGTDLTLLRRMTAEQVELEPAVTVDIGAPFQKVIDISDESGVSNFVVVDGKGRYAGLVVGPDIRLALLQRDAVPLLAVADLMRPSVPMVLISDDLSTVLDAFALHDVDLLPVTLTKESGKVVGLITRAGLMRRYQRGLTDG
jgi:CIC family chloride channel protein